MEPTEHEPIASTSQPPASYPPARPFDATQPPMGQPTLPVPSAWGTPPSPPYPLQPYPQPYQSPYPPQPSLRRPSRMPRTQALAFVSRLKRGTLWFSLAGFAALVGLAASHATGVTAAQSTSPTTQPSGSDDDQSPANQQGGGFFGNSGDNGNSGNSGSFGSGGAQAPISGSSVS